MAGGKELRKRHLAGLLIGLGAALVSLACWSAGLMRSFEASSFDLRVRLLAQPGTATDDIRIILLDQKSLEWAESEFGLGWPWPRQVYAPIVDFCRRAEAASLSFDVVFTEPSVFGVSDDQALADSMTAYGRTVLPVDLHLTDGSDELWHPGIPMPPRSVEGLDRWPGRDLLLRNLATFPIPQLATHAAELGNVNNDPDQDTVYRRITPLLHFSAQHVPSLSLAAYLAAHPKDSLSLEENHLRVGEHIIPLTDEGHTILNYRGKADAYQPVSAAAVIQSELRLAEGKKPVLDPADFKGKYVFFGFSATGLLDLRPSPLGGVTPGVVINATLLDNLLSDDFLRMVPPWVTVLLTLTLSMGIGVGHVLTRSISATVFMAFLAVGLPMGLSIAGYREGWWLPLMVQLVAVIQVLSLTGLYRYATEGRQRRFIKNAFSQYLSPQVIDQLLEDPERLQLGGERREISIFFSDLQGFTTISESLEPEELTSTLNEYLTAMTDIIQGEGGTVDKYEGDAIIAFWNAPVDQPDHARRALRAALACQDKLTEMRPHFKDVTGHAFHMRIGLNTGPAVVGNLGSNSRFDYTMLGDAVNLAARLEGANKQFGTYTMISQATLDAARESEGPAIHSRELARLQVVGKNRAVTVHEPMTERENTVRAERDETFAKGLAAFYAGDIPKARALFASIAETDPAAARYTARCDGLDAPGQDWNGVWTLTTK